jgi:4-hydroxybenzoate polyprenyltransferase
VKIVLAYIRLTRPANIVTAIADILAGFSISVSFNWWFSGQVPDFHMSLFPVLATVGLYGGGVVMNDVADEELDKIERPERPIPSGLATKAGATVLGLSLLVFGIVSAFVSSVLTGEIAIGIAVLALVYDYFGKHHKFFGPINMGMCRGGNLLLGISAISWVVPFCYEIAVIPIIYIAAITMISRGEVVGGNKNAIGFAGILYSIVIAGILLLHHFLPQAQTGLYTIGFLILFALVIYIPLLLAYVKPEPMKIRTAVKSGVIALIAMDAAIATSFSGWIMGLLILALLPVSLLLAKVFSVT